MSESKKIICTVTNDLNYDQRMKKICSSLIKAGYDVLLVGRKRKNSKNLQERSFNQHRINCFFDAGKLFYLEYNLRLFFFLISQKAFANNAIDTDSLLANYLASKIRRTHLVFDGHEYFTEMEEVVERPITKWIWKIVENICLPSVSAAYTISKGYAKLFEGRFTKNFEIVRNIAVFKQRDLTKPRNGVLYQGSVNHGRGLEKLIQAMPNIKSSLTICGEGDLYQKLQNDSLKLNLTDKIHFTGYISPAELEKHTIKAQVGITLFSNDGLSNHHSLCNRFFDYLHNAVPQIAMAYPEYVAFNNEFEVAILLDELTPENIANAINKLLTDSELYNRLKANAIAASKEYQWQNEEKKLISLYNSLPD